MMASEREAFHLCGPLHLTDINWSDAAHRRSIAACLVQGVYIIERDRQLKRDGPHALAPPWWEFLHFKLLRRLIDDADFCIFGAIYEFIPPSSLSIAPKGIPQYVIAFRGTLTKPESLSRDLELDLHVIQNGLHRSSRFEIAIQAVRGMVSSVGGLNVWLAGHSLGAAIAMLAGKTLAKTGIFVDSFLFNPPFLSAPIEKINNKNVKHGIRIAASVITAGLAIANSSKNPRNQQSDQQFVTLAAWVPDLYVNPADHVCSEYVGYFEHRKKMEDIGIGGIEKLATQNSLTTLLMNAVGKQRPHDSEPLHLIPSACLTINLTPSSDLKEAHGIHQWWSSHVQFESKLYRYI